MGHRDLLVTQTLSQPPGNHRSVPLTRSVRRAGGLVQTALSECGKLRHEAQGHNLIRQLFSGVGQRATRTTQGAGHYDLAVPEYGSRVNSTDLGNSSTSVPCTLVPSVYRSHCSKTIDSHRSDPNQPWSRWPSKFLRLIWLKRNRRSASSWPTTI